MSTKVFRQSRSSFEMRLEGFDVVKAALNQGGPVARKVIAGIADRMVLVVYDLLSEAVKRAPIKEGTLRASGYARVLVGGKVYSKARSHAFRTDTGRNVSRNRLADLGEEGVPIDHRIDQSTEGDTTKGFEIIGIVGFGMPYARKQHDIPYNHPLGGEDHYLENPLKEKASVYAGDLISGARKAVA